MSDRKADLRGLIFDRNLSLMSDFRTCFDAIMNSNSYINER